MKNYAIAALAAVPCIVAVAPAATVEDYTAIMDEQFACVHEMVTVLDTVKDKASADAAAAQVTAIMEKSKALEARADALGEPSPEILAQLQASMEGRQEEIAALFQSFIPALISLSQKDFYGSDALKAVFENWMGDAIEEDED